MFDIKNHRLHRDNNQVDYKLTPNRGNIITPKWLVMHYTAGSSYSGAVNWLSNPVAKASAHLVINYDGSITQLAPFNVRTWHAGKSFWNGVSGINGHSIGIELVNKGYATNPADDAISAMHENGGPVRNWQIYPEKQFQTALEIAAELRQKYDLEDVIGHDDIAPTRKSDPGPAFDMARFKAAMFGNDDTNLGNGNDLGGEHPTVLAEVNTGNAVDSLNLRAWPSMESKIIDKIPHTTLVVVIRKNPGSHKHWSEVVHNNKKGWVGTNYLKF